MRMNACDGHLDAAKHGSDYIHALKDIHHMPHDDKSGFRFYSPSVQQNSSTAARYQPEFGHRGQSQYGREPVILDNGMHGQRWEVMHAVAQPQPIDQTWENPCEYSPYQPTSLNHHYGIDNATYACAYDAEHYDGCCESTGCYGHPEEQVTPMLEPEAVQEDCDDEEPIVPEGFWRPSIRY